MNTILVSNPIEVHGRLQELGLSEVILRETVEAGERIRLTCTANHPRTTPGYLRWSEMVKVLRDHLMASGWTKRDDGGVPTVVHPKEQIAIAVMTGNEGTGNETAGLRSKNRKGAATAAFVEQNFEQLEFDRNAMGIKTISTKPGVPMTWYLVVNRVGDEVRFEFSLPSGINDGHVESWQERLLFAPVDLNPAPESITPPSEKSEDIVVEVTRKF